MYTIFKFLITSPKQKRDRVERNEEEWLAVVVCRKTPFANYSER